MSNSKISRRSVLGLGGAAVAAGIAGLPAVSLAAGRKPKKQAKNIIFCVSDGMSMGVPAMLEHYMQLVEGKSSTWTGLMKDPEAVKGAMDTRSLSGIVTDSAAASSSWGSGRHVWNGMINTYPDGTELAPILRLMREKGKMATGLVSTATITHATPAGFAVCIDQRDKEREIAEKYLDAGVDVYLGGGDRFFAAGKDQSDLYAEFAAKGYAVSKDRTGLIGTSGSKLLGIYSNSHVPYEIDRLNDPAINAKVPSLASMTAHSLKALARQSRGFILQVEGARIDHAAHANDAAGLLFDQMAFDQALAVALEFARKDGETLVIATSDHGNSNPGVIGAGDEYFDSTSGLVSLSRAKASYETLLPRLIPLRSVADVQGLVEDRLGAKLTTQEAQMVLDAIGGKHWLSGVDQYRIVSSTLSLVLSNHTHVCWSGRQHSNEYTTLTAWGPGAEDFGGLVYNVDVFGKLLAHRDIMFTNPSMSYEDAKQRMDSRRKQSLADSIERHWI